MQPTNEPSPGTGAPLDAAWQDVLDPVPAPRARTATARRGERALVDPDRSARSRTYRPAVARGGAVDVTAPAAAGQPGRRRPRRGGRGPEGIDPRPGHIPGLDGLRAIAIVSVLVFHFVPAALPGGYLGVDVFFVVSGFLITTLLLRELAQRGRVDLPGFWKRRARRLLPALAVVVLVSVTAARLVGGDLLVGIGRQTLGALTFTTNWLEIAAGASYFHTTSPILFINFWSLAVEEQFYLLWPLTLVVALALTRTTRQRLYAVGGIGLASAVAMAVLHTPGTDATRVYYGTDTHLMGLMAGAVLALAWADPTHRAGLRSAVWRRWRWAAVLGSLLVLGALMRWMDESSPLTFRGGILLASLATVVLVAGLLESPGPWRTAMQLAPLRWLGERSYGIYLWHWPVLILAGALVPYAVGTTRGWVVLGSALVTTLLLSELSLRVVERPVRRHGLRASVRSLGRWLRTPWQVSRTPRVVASVVALMLVLTGVAVATAPEKSSTQQQIEDTESRLNGTSAASGAGSAVEAGTDGIGSGAELGQAPGDAAAAEEGSRAAGAGLGLGQVDAEGGEAGSEQGSEDTAADDARPTEEGADAEEPAAPAPADAVEVNGSAFSPDVDGLLVPSGETITAFGDSLVVTSADGLTHRFPGIGYVAQSNRQWRDAPAVLEQALAEGAVRDNVVLHLGTNAGVDEQGLRAALEAFGPERNVVVMNLFVNASFTAGSNATIEAVVAEHPNAVVGDWHGTISEQPQVLQADKVHPDMDGMHVYAEVVARAFDELARRGR
ncbi:acyltransferase family protein [Ornithinimicrobium pekingense]|uniref:acyltransferase family protein n=1 Tax=Ornithinimicrobium pekingense TaxID=384677 RepID=UPI00146F81AF|nr:acyltransferase family protein [Ornithinimicrobium pekingense]